METKEIIYRKTDAIIDRIGTGRELIIPLLQAIQQEFNYLPSDALNRLYERTDIDRAQLISVATFYSQLRMVPYGKHVIKVCIGTACHVKGANNVYDAFRRELQLEGDDITTADGLYSIEKVACLGCCALAPVVQIDEKIFGPVLPGKVREVLDEFEQMKANEAVEDEGMGHGEPQGEVRLGMENCCQASGTAEVYAAVVEACKDLGIHVRIKPVSCVGTCNQVPLIDVATPDGNIVRYPNIKPDEVKEILLHHFRPSSRLRRLRNAILNQIDTFHTDQTWDNILFIPEKERTQSINTFLNGQFRISTEGYGHLNPLDLEEYLSLGGFEALKKAVTEMSPQQVIDEVLKSGIRGRGGGGFLTGKKWQLVRENANSNPNLNPNPSALNSQLSTLTLNPDSQPSTLNSKLPIVICNGDEGDPGAFMDRILLESYPLRVIEGMIMAGYAVGANEGIFYIRAEYPQAVIRVRKALDMCRQKGLLGEHIYGSEFSFDIRVFEGAGAFVCGEETALIASLEGKRGFPHIRPPYPAQEGLNGRPTLINNVETLSQISYIIRHGADEYAKVGTQGSRGTKVFALAGKVNHGGLIEVPMGTTLRQIVDEIGGGVEGGEKLKAVQIGGPSGGCIPAELCDAEVDFDALNQMGAIMGSGGLVVLSESSCMVDVARYFTNFTCSESCGKCTFCRIGIRRMLDILDRLTKGEAQMEDIDLLEELALSIRRTALCGLGKTAPNPVLSTLRYFRHEYEEHVQGICRTGSCKQMVKLEITDDCVGCTKCARSCPSEAIAYTPYEKHVIDTDKCTQCGLCVGECDYKAIVKVKV